MTPQNYHSVFAGSADWNVNLARAEFSSPSKDEVSAMIILDGPTGDLKLDNGAISATVTALEGQWDPNLNHPFRECGFVFRYHDPEHFYVAGMGGFAKRFYIARVSGSDWRFLAGSEEPAASLEFNSPYDLRVEFESDRIILFHGNAEVSKAVDNAYASGSCGLRTNRTRGRFQNVDIEALRELGIQPEEIRAENEGPASEDAHISQQDRAPAGSPEVGGGEPRPNTSGPPDSRGRLSPHVSGPRHAVEQATKSPAPTDEELWSRMSESGRKVLERAAGMAEAGIRDAIHMEHLVAAVFEDWRRFFERGSLPDTKTLRKTIWDAVGKDLMMDAPPRELSRLPPLSGHARQALSAAGNLAQVHQNQQISSGQILRGMLTITECAMVKALRDKGLKESDLQPEDPSWTAAPTPKVDSDLWCEEDRLGYEEYARTIAELITHPETVAPLTIGIKAPWGAGKTSLMKRVQHLLDGQAYLTEENRSGGRQGSELRMTLRELLEELKWTTQEEQTGLKKKNNAATELKLLSTANPEGKRYRLPPRITVWFNAWKYQTSEQIWAGMAHCIISQVTARMTPRDRELFWLRLHARRVNADEVRRKIYDAVLRQIFPFSLMVMVACGVVAWVVAASPVIPLPHVWQGVTVLCGLFGVIWKAWDKLGDKAASTVKELVREPDYEGKMGYLHLVESDIREVLNLATTAGAKARAAELRSARQPAAVPTRISIAQPTTAQSSTSQPSTKEKEKPAPLVVFVDDLDRCAPNKVAEVVEAINLFLCGDYPNCIFVLGMEPGMVAAALEVANKDVIAKAKEMGLVDGAAPVGWRFMEKIVQMPVMIPPPTKHGRDAYVKSLVGSAGGTSGGPAAATPAKSVEVPKREPPKEEDVQAFAEEMKGATLAEVEKKSLEIVAAASAEKRQAAAEAGKRVYAQTFSERDPMIADFVQECAELVEGNPRQIKRYVNVFRFFSALRYGLKADGLATENELPNDKVLAKFVAMSIQWPHAMDCLRCRHATDERGQTISRLEHLETKSAEIRGDDAAGDAAWKELVGEKGMGLESWAHARAFRMFLARGELLGKSRGHGLW